jgi:O-antigen/teichoic acid export membrane protein
MSEPDDTLGSSEVRHRAVRGGIALIGRGTALRALGLLTNLVLARILVPREFGELAIGLTVVALASLFVTGGLGSALVRRSTPPRRSELQGVLAMQLLLGALIALVTAAVALPFGRTGVVTTIMTLALPVTAIRTPGVVLTERRMQYGPIVLSEVTETAVYAACAIGAALVGFGVYGVAAAGLVRAFTGSVAMLVAVPEGRLWPRLHWAEVRPIMGFGAKFQAASLIGVGRDQALNVGLAVAGSLSVLGLWGLALRLLQAPFLMFEALWRVSFPAVARMLDAGDDVSEPLRRTAATLGVGVGIVLVALAGSAWDLVPFAFGERWASAAPAVALPCVGLLLSGPVSVVSAGFLYARGDAGAALWATAISSIVVVACSVSLVAATGEVWGVGVGQCLGAIVEAVIFLRATRRHGLDGIATQAVVTTACGAVAVAAGWLACESIANHLLGACAAMALSVAVFGLTLCLVDFRALRETARLGRRTLRNAAARDAEPLSSAT